MPVLADASIWSCFDCLKLLAPLPLQHQATAFSSFCLIAQQQCVIMSVAHGRVDLPDVRLGLFACDFPVRCCLSSTQGPELSTIWVQLLSSTQPGCD